MRAVVSKTFLLVVAAIVAGMVSGISSFRSADGVVRFQLSDQTLTSLPDNVATPTCAGFTRL